jgi:DNA replication and repair protein RecF
MYRPFNVQKVKSVILFHRCETNYLRRCMYIPLQILGLKLAHFKNYTAQSLSFSPALNCLVGLNGMGKTNVLDAIHFLCLTKSHRTLPDKNLVQSGADFMRVEGQLAVGDSRHKVVIKMPADKRKELEIDGVTVNRLADHIGRFPAVMIAPDDVTLVQEGSEERRRYMDSTLSQVSPEYLHNLVLFNALLKQRNALLKSFAEQRRFEPLLLEAIDRQMYAPAYVVHHARQEMVTTLEPLFTELYKTISGGQEAAQLRLISDWPDSDNYADTLAANTDRDRFSERTAAGPHRDDLEFNLNEMPVKKYASQGQLKSFLLALRLAQYEMLRARTGISPILLLDDIFDKLDANRVRQLVGLLLERNVGQVFITDTQRARIEEVVASFAVDFMVFEVENGRI